MHIFTKITRILNSPCLSGAASDELSEMPSPIVLILPQIKQLTTLILFIFLVNRYQPLTLNLLQSIPTTEAKVIPYKQIRWASLVAQW